MLKRIDSYVGAYPCRTCLRPPKHRAPRQAMPRASRRRETGVHPRIAVRGQAFSGTCASAITLATTLVLLSHAPAHAQAVRTFVAANGNDAAVCSSAAPCRTFAGAIAKT